MTIPHALGHRDLDMERLLAHIGGLMEAQVGVERATILLRPLYEAVVLSSADCSALVDKGGKRIADFCPWATWEPDGKTVQAKLRKQWESVEAAVMRQAKAYREVNDGPWREGAESEDPKVEDPPF